MNDDDICERCDKLTSFRLRVPPLWLCYPCALTVTWSPPPAPKLNPLGLLNKLIPALKAEYCCPEETCSGRSVEHFLSTLIIHLNDHHQWSRESIADWLETLDLDLRFPVA